MSNQNNSLNQPSEEAKDKLVYSPPVLTAFGMVRDLTATGSGTTTENMGADDKNNMLMMP